uniref:cGMP-dependent protein kinase N-terminal coiled-coil domain-containing protein n=1 Tax=Timema monikensis TaxID=170555 RepID=A0A7R9HTU7_9NEOP|nr:unnamed protein product [Timema monikensis]
MRVCFENLCFSSQRLAEDEEVNRSSSLHLTTASHQQEAAVVESGGTLSNGTRHNSVVAVVVEKMGSLQELQSLLQSKDERIAELEKELRRREEEILELRSQLDKFQSVFPYHMSPTHKNNHINNNINQLRPRKQRAQGISAEPQTLSTIQELSQQTFPTYPKNDRYSLTISTPQDPEVPGSIPGPTRFPVKQWVCNRVTLSLGRTNGWRIRLIGTGLRARYEHDTSTLRTIRSDPLAISFSNGHRGIR